MIDTNAFSDEYLIGRPVPVRPLRKKPVPRDHWLALAPIALLAAISALAYYFGLTRLYPLADFYGTPHLELGKLTLGSPQSANWWIGAWAVIFASYYLAFRICPTGVRTSIAFRRTALMIILAGAAVSTVCLVFMYPITAADIFDQIFRARITTHYAHNPFTTFPDAFPQDRLLPYVAWPSEGSPYGPVWELLATIPALLAGDSLWNNLIYFKALVVLFYGVSTLLTYLILRTLKPDWALRGTLFFAWNPLLIYEVAGNGHNDIVMVTFVLLAIYLFVLGRRIGVFAALMLGVLTKFIPLLLVPLAVAAIWRDRVSLDRGSFHKRDRGASKGDAQPGTTQDVNANTTYGTPMQRLPVSNRAALTTLAIGCVLALALAVILYAPFWEGTKTIGALDRQSLFTTSIPTLSYLLLESNLNISTVDAKGIARNAAIALTVCSMIGLTLFVFLKGNARTATERRALVFRTLGAFYEMIFIYLAFASLWFQPWYLIWLVALTAPVALYTNANRTVLFCIGGITNYFVWFFIWGWGKGGPLDITVTAVLALFFLPLFYTVYSTLKALYERIWE